MHSVTSMKRLIALSGCVELRHIINTSRTREAFSPVIWQFFLNISHASLSAVMLILVFCAIALSFTPCIRHFDQLVTFFGTSFLDIYCMEKDTGQYRRYLRNKGLTFSSSERGNPSQNKNASICPCDAKALPNSTRCTLSCGPFPRTIFWGNKRVYRKIRTGDQRRSCFQYTRYLSTIFPLLT